MQEVNYIAQNSFDEFLKRLLEYLSVVRSRVSSMGIYICLSIGIWD